MKRSVLLCSLLVVAAATIAAAAAAPPEGSAKSDVPPNVKVTLFVGKSGGLTVAEVLACGRPLLVTRTLQGQESFNVRFLERHGIGRLVGNEELAQQVREWLESPELLQDIQARAAAAGRRDGALRVAEQVLELAARRMARVARRSVL